MYGKIHKCVKELVLSKFGQDAWNKVMIEANFDETKDFLMFKSYDDEKTFQLITAACKVSGLPLETVLEVFGQTWLKFCMDNGYEEMLRTLGGDFTSFVQNLDALHAHLSRTYTKLNYPSFRCETNNDGTLTLHYYSKRSGLYYIVLGVIPQIASVLYNQKATITVDSREEQDIENGILDDHVIFTVKLSKNDGNTTVNNKEDSSTIENNKELVCIRPTFPKQTIIQAKHFCNIFPYHLIFDENFVIKQCGSMIQILLKTKMERGSSLTSLFDLTYPRVDFTLTNLMAFINSAFLMTSVKKRNGHSLVLKGQMRWMPDISHMIFISSPCISSLQELKAMDLYISDIPLYDVTRELILLNQQRMAEMEIAKKLDETTADLTKMSKALEIEKNKTDELLHEMLPTKVATELLAGRTVDAEKFENVTILFSDIVTFTNIASACTPMDIVNLLNNLYQRFDNLTTVHNVYKVETIGDAYMVVSGVPTRTNSHAEDVANFSLDMVNEAGKVQSPATGESIQIRVGFHSGSVVAGVVGLKMPRYCLFGDTVNTSSRMESHGIPARVHASPQSAKLLIDKGYVFRDRGKNKIKGKGLMSTYILINRSGQTYEEPDDAFCKMPIAKTVDMDIEIEVLPDKTHEDKTNEDKTNEDKTNEDKTNELKERSKSQIQSPIIDKPVERPKSRSVIVTRPIPISRRQPPLQKQNSSTCMLS
ncbi:guanylate cyclase soluble subunit beta-2-like [Mytilus edulis]|uniref:guanylate cyclase soluble subunit beta-2-like n=1 Tax=Mytilus edulis TaxID=6550 RepID=UPI0039EEF0E4